MSDHAQQQSEGRQSEHDVAQQTARGSSEVQSVQQSVQPSLYDDAIDSAQPPQQEQLRPPQKRSSVQVIKRLWAELSLLDKLLTPFILIAMILGVVIGEYAPNAKENLTGKGGLQGVSAPLVVGLIVMMWPILTKVRYETIHRTFKTSRLWMQIFMSLLLNWIVGPFVMFGLAWATLPDLPTYREGIIMVGLARCIAMVMIWNQLARGDLEVCAILVIINSVLQMALYAPYAVWFINVMSDADSLQLQYGTTAIAVLVYLGIPLAAGVITRFGMLALFGRRFFEEKFLPYFGPLSLIALLYTIIIIFAEQAGRILDNLGPTFRTFVPLVLYFAIMWTVAFVLVWRFTRRYGDTRWGYELAVVQSFTAASNNFELAIAIAVAVYGADSDQALAATIGPLVEVPALLLLSWVALFLREMLHWNSSSSSSSSKDERHPSLTDVEKVEQATTMQNDEQDT